MITHVFCLCFMFYATFVFKTSNKDKYYQSPRPKHLVNINLIFYVNYDYADESSFENVDFYTDGDDDECVCGLKSKDSCEY